MKLIIKILKKRVRSDDDRRDGQISGNKSTTTCSSFLYIFYLIFT